MDYSGIIEKIRMAGYKITEPLTDEEHEKIKQIYGIEFPTELLNLYKVGIPTKKMIPSEGKVIDGNYAFYDWHDFSDDNISRIRSAMDFAYKDKNVPDTAPKMIPVMSHRYCPQMENEVNIPIFSIHYDDVIIYGKNLEDYVERELKMWDTHEPVSVNECTWIPYWSDLLVE